MNEFFDGKKKATRLVDTLDDSTEECHIWRVKFSIFCDPFKVPIDDEKFPMSMSKVD